MSYWRQPQNYDQGYNNYGYGDRNMNNAGYGGGYGSYVDGGYGGARHPGGGAAHFEATFGRNWNNSGGGYGGGSYGGGRSNRGGGYGNQRRNDDNRVRQDDSRRKRNFRDQQGGPKRTNPKMPKLLADYYFENGLRKVYPYFFTFFTTAQKRWEDRELLDIFTDEYPSNTKENYKKAIEKGTILVNDQRVPLDYVIKSGDSVSSKAHRHEDPVLDLPIQIVHEDNDILVVNKPPGIPCNPSGRFKANAVLSILLHDLNLQYLKNMYHLDWQSSGLMVFGKNTRKFESLDHQVHHGMVKKQFMARVVGEFPLGKVTVDNPQESVSHKLSLWRISGNGKPSKTTFERVSYNGKSSVVKCIPEVGRTSHQIRVHLQYMGHPIINDRVYNSEAWGENKGKGGVYERPMEEVIEELSNIDKVANVGEWLDDENPILTQKAAKEAEDQAKEEERARKEEEALQAAKDKVDKEAGEENMAEGEAGTEAEGEGGEAENEAENETEAKIEDEPAEVAAEDAEKDDAKAAEEDEEVTAMDTSENSEPQAKRVKTDDEAEDEAKGEDKEDDDTPKVAYSRYKTRGQIFVVKHKPFNIDKWSPAENCLECLKTYQDPQPESLVIFLHAQMFESPDWQYYSKLPEWAQEDWHGPEED